MPANIWPCALWPYEAEKPVTITSHGPDNVLLIQTAATPATPYTGA